VDPTLGIEFWFIRFASYTAGVHPWTTLDHTGAAW